MKAVALEEVAELNPPLAKKLSADDEVAFVPMAALSAEAASVTAEETRTYAEVAKGYTSFTSGDVLVAKITPCFENGKIAQTSLSKPIGFGSTEFHVVRPRPDKLDGRYAHHFLRLENVRTAGERRMTGSGGQRRVPENYLAKLQIPLPPLPEQRRIAAVLDKADELRAKRRATLAELDTLNAAVFAEMFGDATAILEKWPAKSLGELLTFLTSGSRGWAKHYAERGDLFLRIQNVRHDKLDLQDVAYVIAPDTAEAKRTLVQPGDVLLSITADLGRTAVIPEKLGKAFINQHLCILRTKSLVPRFLSAYLASPAGQLQVERQNRQAVKAGLNFEDIRSFVIPTPPIETQREFANRVTTIEALTAKHHSALAELDTLFASLQNQLFARY